MVPIAAAAVRAAPYVIRYAPLVLSASSSKDKTEHSARSSTAAPDKPSALAGLVGTLSMGLLASTDTKDKATPVASAAGFAIGHQVGAGLDGGIAGAYVGSLAARHFNGNPLAARDISQGAAASAYMLTRASGNSPLLGALAAAGTYMLADRAQEELKSRPQLLSMPMQLTTARSLQLDQKPLDELMHSIPTPGEDKGLEMAATLTQARQEELMQEKLAEASRRVDARTDHALQSIDTELDKERSMIQHRPTMSPR